MTLPPASLQAPRVFTLGAPDGFHITVTDFGATWLSCCVPVPGQPAREVLLGHARTQDWTREPGYLGATLGRWANRIARARFDLDGRTCLLAANDGANQLHGGPDSFSRRTWQLVQADASSLSLELQSPAGDQGFPGNLRARVSYRVDAWAHSVQIDFEAQTDAATPVSLSNHAYFNLDGDAFDARSHTLRVAASRYLPVDPQRIPTGLLQDVQGTAFDLLQPQRLADVLAHKAVLAPTRGLDHCMVLDAEAAQGQAPAAELVSGDGRVRMQLFTDYPGLQVYTGNHLTDVHGRDGQRLRLHGGVALEPQFFPDSPNRPSWQVDDGERSGCILRPGRHFRRFERLVFSTA